MAGTLVIDTLNASSGVLAARNGMTGICKAWILYNGSAATVTGSFNVGSVTKNGTGDYTLNFTTAMADVNYAVSGSTGSSNPANMIAIKSAGTGSTATLKSTSQVEIIVGSTASGALTDNALTSVAILGN